MKHCEITTLRNRLLKLGIEIKLSGNAPWIYLCSVNGNKVKEKFAANHGFTIAFYGKYGSDKETVISDIGEVFKIIRKYIK